MVSRGCGGSFLGMGSVVFGEPKRRRIGKAYSGWKAEVEDPSWQRKLSRSW